MFLFNFYGRWGVFVESIAEFQDTMMGGIGHCGSYPCLGAVMPLKSSMKSMSAERLTQMLIFAAWLLTTRNKFSAWPLSFRNPPPVLKVLALGFSFTFPFKDFQTQCLYFNPLMRYQ